MTAIFQRDGSRFVLGVLLALLGGAWFAPTEARAGCGDHLSSVLSSVQLTPLDLSQPPLKKDCACSGPHCTRSPVAPIPTPSVPAQSSGQEAAYLVPLQLLLGSDSLRIALDHRHDYLPVVATDIYHPPR